MSSQPQQAPGEQPVASPEVIPPNVPQTHIGVGTYSVSQVTQVNQALPAHVWNTDLVREYLHMLKDNDDKNRAAFETMKQRENSQAWAGLVIIAGIVAFGLYLVAIGNSYGRDLVGSTVLFLAGYLAGHGQGKAGK
ncbi:MAG: hypothetical protein AB7O65_12340 [Candidatus Korobacteraceae bacterium]